MKMCFNWKVLTGLAVVGVGVWITAPNLIAGALPLLLALACPLSMVFMMKGMSSMGGMQAQHAGQGGAPTHYTCPMHPDVQSDQPGRCPQCSMQLVPATKQATQAASTPLTAPTMDREAQLAELQLELQQAREHQDTLAQRLAALEAPQGTPSSAAVREAEQIARSAKGRP